MCFNSNQFVLFISTDTKTWKNELILRAEMYNDIQSALTELYSIKSCFHFIFGK